MEEYLYLDLEIHGVMKQNGMVRGVISKSLNRFIEALNYKCRLQKYIKNSKFSKLIKLLYCYCNTVLKESIIFFKRFL